MANPSAGVSNPANAAITTSSPISLETIVNMIRNVDSQLKAFILEHREAMNKINESLGTLQKIVGTVAKHAVKVENRFIDSLNLNKSKIGSLNALPKIVDTVAEHAVRIRNLEIANSQLRQEIEDLKKQLATREPPLNKVVFTGFPEGSSEAPRDLVSKVLSALGLAALEIHILSVRILRRKIKPQDDILVSGTSASQPKSLTLLVTLTSFAVRDTIIRAKRAKGVLLLGEVLDGNVNGKIYVNEFLPARAYDLFRQTRSRARNANYKYVWIVGGTIRVRKADGEPIITITELEDLNNLA